MANHRPKSLSELNNVYDKAMRAERAIKEGSNLLSTPEPETASESENIFEQLENKAAEAHKNQVFDPDITNIANDFLKRYAQPEKPKAPAQEIKRPAPSIQVYHTPVKHSEPKEADIPLNMGNDFASSFSAPSVPVHKPSHDAPSTRVVAPEIEAPAENVTEQFRIPAPEIQQTTPAPIVKASAPAPETKQAPVKAQPAARFDHTPRPAPSRVRITSTERSELMEEYMRVMSDEDDEPSGKKSVFSFFKKKKRYDEDEADFAENLYDSYDEAYEDTADEATDESYDSSEVRFEDEYSNLPEESEEAQADEETMNLYDYMAADLDFDAEDNYEEDEDDLLDVSFVTGAAVQQELSYEAQEDETEEEAPQQETDHEEVAEEYETELTEESEKIEEAEEIAEVQESSDEEILYAEAPTAGMVFEDVFSVTDESKRSLTGGNWTEVFGDELPAPISDEAEEIITEPEVVQEAEIIEEAEEIADAQEYTEEPVEIAEVQEYTEEVADIQEYAEEITETEESQEYVDEAVIYPTEEAEMSQEASDEEIAPAETIVYEDISSGAAAEEDSYAYQEDEEESVQEEDFDDYDAPKKRTGLKILMSIAIVICFITATATALLWAVIGVDTGKVFSDNLRAFSVPETISDLGLNKGDLVITENIYAQADNLYVFVNQATHAYDFGKVTSSTTSLSGDILYISQTKDGTQLINRDTSMGVIVTTYDGIGSVLSVVCDYSIAIIIALVILIIALIVCLVIITRKRRLYEEASAIYDHMDNNDDDDYDDDESDGENEDDEYYSDYDTDGIEQGLFTSI